MPRRHKNARPRCIGLWLSWTAKEHRRIYGGENGRKEPSNTAKRVAHIGQTDLFEKVQPTCKAK